MKHFLILIYAFFIIGISISKSQPIIYDTETRDLPINLYYNNYTNSYYIIYNEAGEIRKTVLMEVNSNGGILSKRILAKSDSIGAFNFFYKNNEGYLGVNNGETHLDNENYIKLVQFDTLFNEQWQKSIFVSYDVKYYTSRVLEINNNYFVCVEYLSFNAPKSKIYSINSDFEITDSLIFNNMQLNMVANFYSVSDNDIYFSFYGINSIGTSGYYLYKLDTFLNIKDSLYMPLLQHCHVNKINNLDYIIAGTDYIHNSEYQVYISKLDSNFNIKKEVIFGTSDSTQGTLGKCLDRLFNDHIYVMATHGYDPTFSGNHPYQKTPAYIYLSRFDDDLQLLWERFYGDGKYYYTGWIINSDSDKGVSIVGTTYNRNETKELDIVFIKVDENGNITTNIENKPQNLHNALLYPNPAKETLNLRTAVQYVPATLEVYNISGIKVLMENITATEQTINIASLTTGNYIFRIIFQNETIETGKFIVE